MSEFKSNTRKVRRRRPNAGKNSRRKDLTTSGSGSQTAMLYEPWMPVFPASITKRLRYSTTFVASTMSGAITSTYIFRANDLFDPDFTSTGHQPMGFDQIMVWYNHFTVRTAKIICLFKNQSPTSCPTVCLRVDGDSTPLTVIDRVVEAGGCVTADLEFKGQTGSNKKLQLSVDIARLQGVNPDTICADANLRGTVATGPVEVTYFHITSWDTTGTTAVGIEVDVVLEQTATFYEPRDPVQS